MEVSVCAPSRSARRLCAPAASPAPWVVRHCRSAQSSCSASYSSERCLRSVIPWVSWPQPASNSRGDQQLLRLQRQAVGLQVVLTDATQSSARSSHRINAPPGPGFSGGVRLSGLDQAIGNDIATALRRLGPDCFCRNAQFGSFHLSTVDPESVPSCSRRASLFYPDHQRGRCGSASTNRPFGAPTDSPLPSRRKVRADARADSASANDLIAANRSSFATPRNPLIGVGAGSLAPALALGLLLAWSVVGAAPRRAEIAAESLRREARRPEPRRDRCASCRGREPDERISSQRPASAKLGDPRAATSRTSGHDRVARAPHGR